MDGAKGDTGEHRCCSDLDIATVRRLVAQHLFSGTRLEHDGQLVSHRSAGDEHRCVLANGGRRFLFESVHGWIVVVHVVAHLGIRHRPPHLGGGTRDGVRTEVGNAVGETHDKSVERGNSAPLFLPTDRLR